MPAIFIIDGSSKEPSPLVQRLIRSGYHVLCLTGGKTAMETLRCIRPDLMIVDVAAMGIHAAVGTLRTLARTKAERSPVPVLLIGAKPLDHPALDGLIERGEIIPARRSTPDDVLKSVRRYIRPAPGRRHEQEEQPAAGGAGRHNGRGWGWGWPDEMIG